MDRITEEFSQLLELLADVVDRVFLVGDLDFLSGACDDSLDIVSETFLLLRSERLVTAIL